MSKNVEDEKSMAKKSLNPFKALIFGATLAVYNPQ